MRVEVRNYANSKRLLGYVIDPPEALGAYVTYALMPPRASFNFYPEDIPTLDVERVDFSIAWHFENNGYLRRAFFQTSEPLEKLSRVKNFRYPGETEEQAYHRQQWQM